MGSPNGGSRLGTRFGPYELQSLIGMGGMGEVYRAHDTVRERMVAIKMLRPDLAAPDTGRLTVLGSLAAADAVEAICGLRPMIKWPNDLMIGTRKLAGLLIEAEPKGNRVAFAVMGIGINLRQEEADFSPDVRALATSIYLSTGQMHRRSDLLVALLHALGNRLGSPFDEAREAWTASSLTLGQRVTLTTLRGPKHGQAIGMDESGALLLRGDSGEIEAITAGDMRAC